MKVLAIVATKNKRDFDKKMSLFWAYLEHIGIIGGGGWNTKNFTAEALIEAHKESCCPRYPTLNRITKNTIRQIEDWLRQHNLMWKWIR